MNEKINQNKQILNLELITKDVKSEIGLQLIENAIYLMIALFLAFFAIIVPDFSKEVIFVKILISIFIVFMYLFSILIFSLVVFRFIKNINIIINLKKGKFAIVTDRLIEAKKYQHFGISGLLAKLYFLKFEKFCPFEISKKKYYKWSNLCNMYAHSLYQSSLPGDEFYLIVFSQKEPIMIYNKKFFCIPKAEQSGKSKSEDGQF